jgi:hypothetical protein
MENAPLSWRICPTRQLLPVLLLGACYTQDTGAGVNISVHSVPGILDDTVADWEKAAFGYRCVCVHSVILLLVVARSLSVC